MLRRIIKIAVPAGTLALALAASGCSSAKPTDSPTGVDGSAAAMVAAAGRNLDVNFDPLTSPADAVRKADLIVSGTVVDVTDGISVAFADPTMDGAAGVFTTFVVQVNRVLAGTGARPADRIYVSVSTSLQTNAKELSALNPKADSVLVLEDISAWKPVKASRVVRPAAIPTTARLYTPFTDGLWLQGPRDQRMSSLHAEAADLGSAWGRPQTVQQYASAITAAAHR